MIVPDVNLLLYAVIDGYPHHDAAHEWLRGAIQGPEPVGLSAPAIFGFVRLATSSRVHTHPLSVHQARCYVEEWLARPHVTVLAPGPGHVRIALDLLDGLGTGGTLTTDAQIAANAIEYGGTVFSNDADFGRFPGLRWTNPLAGGA
ncbi:MAG: PIN domain-containing protein [Mobilicoccus sp.]|nr:PIN domain-containing protein [Mobilicoccus sp.]